MTKKSLEELAFGLVKARKEKNQLEKEVEDYTKDIKLELEKLGIKGDSEGRIVYNGKGLDIVLSITSSYGVILEEALKYGKVKELYDLGIIGISKVKFEDYLKGKKIKLNPKDYLKAEGKTERILIDLKEKKG